MVEDAKTMSRSVAEQARRRGPPGPHPPRLIPRLIPAPGPEAQQQLGGRGPAGQGTARVDLTGRCGEQLRFRSKSWRSHCAELYLRCFGLRCVPNRVLPCCFRSLPNDLNPVLEELENVPTSCQLRGEWAISDEERLSFLDVEGPCTQPGFGRAEEAYYQMLPDKALDRLPNPRPHVLFKSEGPRFKTCTYLYIAGPRPRPRAIWRPCPKPDQSKPPQPRNMGQILPEF